MATIQDILKSREELLERLAEQLAVIRGTAPPSADLPMKEKERTLRGMRDRLGVLENARSATLQRLDRDIERQRALVDRLGQEIAADRANLERAGALTTRPLTEVPGIGPAFRDRLTASGIVDLAALATADPERVAVLLRISQTRAGEIVKAARKVR